MIKSITVFNCHVKISQWKHSHCSVFSEAVVITKNLFNKSSTFPCDTFKLWICFHCCSFHHYEYCSVFFCLQEQWRLASAWLEKEMKNIIIVLIFISKALFLTYYFGNRRSSWISRWYLLQTSECEWVRVA